MDKYTIIHKIGEGSFSEVLKARRNGCTDKGDYVAIKCVKQENSGPALPSKMQITNTIAFENREVFALKLLKPHPHIIQLRDVFIDACTSRVCIVTELMDMNLYEFLQLSNGRGLGEELVKFLTWQALLGLAYVHNNGFFHRDIKPENMLINEETMVLKLADFGSCRQTSSRPPYTEYISTRWYRAPECLLTMGQYSKEMDIWSIGCIMFELLTSRPLFPGRNEAQQLQCIQKILGPPPFALFHRSSHSNFIGCPSLSSTFPPMKRLQPTSTWESLLPGISSECIDLIKSMLLYSPTARITASSALLHPWFKSISSSTISAAKTKSPKHIQNMLSAKPQPQRSKGIAPGIVEQPEGPRSPPSCNPLLRSQSGEKTKTGKGKGAEKYMNKNVDIDPRRNNINDNNRPHLYCSYGCGDDEKEGSKIFESTSETTTASALQQVDSTSSMSLGSSANSKQSSNNNNNAEHKASTKNSQNGLRFTALNSFDGDSKILDQDEQLLPFLSQANSNRKHAQPNPHWNFGQGQIKSRKLKFHPIRFFRGRKES